MNTDQPNPFLHALQQLDPQAELPAGTAQVHRPLRETAVIKGNTQGNLQGNVAATLSSLLAPLGVSGVSERDRVEAEVALFCTDVGLHADLRSLRYGVLTLECETNVARLLELDTESLLERLNVTCAGQVTTVRVRTRSRR
jgi:hypothetical protein